MVHAVHNGVRAGIQEGRTLGNEREEIKEPLPKLRHRKHSVSRIPMKKKGLTKERKKPMPEKKVQYRHVERYL
jgi:hypothetical protein